MFLPAAAFGLLTLMGAAPVSRLHPPHAQGVAAASAYYADSAAGDDRNDGRSPATAWKSLARLNAVVFQPGDRVLLKAGAVWNGDLTPQGSGAAGQPITIDMYGSGAKPKISGVGQNDGAAALLLAGQQYWTVKNLSITNSRSDGSANGIVVATAGKGTLHGIHLIGNEVTAIGKGGAGIDFFTSDALHPGDHYDDVLLDGNYVHNTQNGGIYLNLFPGGTRSTHVVVRNNTIDTVGYDGMLFQACQGLLVEHNTVYRAGTTVQNGGNPIVGLFPINCQDVTIQYNEVAYTGPGLDSQAFDCDNYNSGTILYQYNYSHDNAGGFFEITSDSLHNPSDWAYVRYNISQNDDTQNPINRIQNSHVTFYNNTFYDAKQLVFGENYPVLYQNNVFMAPSASYYVVMGSFDHNVYARHTPPPALDVHAALGDPQFLAAGSGKSGLATTSGYKSSTGSQAFGAGTVIGNNGGQDFFGDALPAGAPDAGAYQHGTTAVSGLSVPQIANGSFESPNVGSGGYSDFLYQPTGTGWLFSGNAGISGNGSGFTAGNSAAPDGSQVAFIQGLGTFSETINAALAGKFAINFQLAQRANWGGTQTFQALVDGSPVGTFTAASSAFSLVTTPSFDLAAGSHTLSFAGAVAGDATAFIDSVGLTQNSVAPPTPTLQTAVGFTSATYNTNSSRFSLGYTFTTGASPLSVTSLGYINDGATGASATHGVQIYQVTSDPNANGGGAGTAVPGASATVTTAGGGPSSVSFTYTPIAPVTLAANTRYEIVATEGGTGFFTQAQNPVYSGIAFGHSVYAVNTDQPVFAPNSFSGNDPGNFGPNFLFTAVGP